LPSEPAASATSLSGRRALVTGAGQRVGQAIALALGRAGMRVAVHYNSSRSGAEATASAIRDAGGDALLLQANLHDRDAARRLADETLVALGGLDLFVASAASFERLRYDELDDDAFDRSLRLNLAAPFALAHRVTPALKASRGSMVFITCTSATAPFKNHLPYVVSKGAVRQLARTLALELAPEVRVNTVAPGTVLPPPTMDAPAIERLVRQIPLGREGTAEDVARAVLYLAQAPFVTGEELVVDGGRTVGTRP
jgi:pteridine reductase